MSTIIIILAVVLVVGSMLWILPSPRQRRQMQMRRLAMRAGLTVQLARLQDPADALQKIHCIAYRLNTGRETKLGAPWLVHAVTGENGELAGWAFENAAVAPDADIRDRAKRGVETLPVDVLALEYTGATLGIYWQEAGNEEDVTRIHEFLMRLAGME